MRDGTTKMIFELKNENVEYLKQYRQEHGVTMVWLINHLIEQWREQNA